MKARFAICVVCVVGQVLSACSVGRIGPNETQMQQARTACSQVGLPAGSSEVSDCAARMQAALLASSQ